MAIQKSTRQLNIIHSSTFTLSLDLNPNLFSDRVDDDFKSEELGKFQAGVLVTVGEDGYAKLADGATTVKAKAVVVPAPGFWMENLPTIASKKLSAIGAPSVIETVQVVEDDIKPGTPIYCGTGENAGLMTSTKGESNCLVGYALSANSADDKKLVVELV